jgi:23S rRNA (adenine2503-C2)-methyltransferase
MLTELKHKSFSNGTVYALRTPDGFLIETTDTFLPYYTKDAIGRKQNKLMNNELGSRKERWMIGISCMAGCPVHCKFCATGNMKQCHNLTAEEMVEQVELIINKNNVKPSEAKEFKINYTRMGEPGLNIDEVKKAIGMLDKKYDGVNIHHYISTIGIKNFDFSWIKDNITLQISLHSLDDNRRNDLIPFKNKMTLKELGAIRTKSNLKTTVNMTLVDEDDFDINKLKELFDSRYFFIKLSPVNVNAVSNENDIGNGIIEGVNLI